MERVPCIQPANSTAVCPISGLLQPKLRLRAACFVTVSSFFETSHDLSCKQAHMVFAPRLPQDRSIRFRSSLALHSG
jgi:hypothetical protein